jgi:hypothetical protein
MIECQWSGHEIECNLNWFQMLNHIRLSGIHNPKCHNLTSICWALCPKVLTVPLTLVRPQMLLNHSTTLSTLFRNPYESPVAEGELLCELEDEIEFLKLVVTVLVVIVFVILIVLETVLLAIEEVAMIGKK